MRPSRYTVKPLASSSSSLQARFVQLGEDDCTRAFLEQARFRRSAVKDNVASLLKRYAGYSTTDANGTVDRGRMFIFGQQHIDLLLPALSASSSASASSSSSPPKRLRTLLDVGAGDGNITAKFSPQFDRTVCTEFSLPMVSRLRKRGFTATTASDDTFQSMGQNSIDLVLFLNVLDRADRPETMLRALKRVLVPETGRLVVAVVLPWCPFVEGGGTEQQRPPTEQLPMQGGRCRDKASFEQSVCMLVERVFTPLGLEVERWSKLPYLCEGEQGGKEYYVLDDAIFVLKAAECENDDNDNDDKEVVVEPSVFDEQERSSAPSTEGGIVDWIAQRLWQ